LDGIKEATLYFPLLHLQVVDTVETLVDRMRLADLADPAAAGARRTLRAARPRQGKAILAVVGGKTTVRNNIAAAAAAALVGPGRLGRLAEMLALGQRIVFLGQALHMQQAAAAGVMALQRGPVLRLGAGTGGEQTSGVLARLTLGMAAAAAAGQLH
jgi:hypothetical protein